MTIYHKHHITPKHMGGSDDSSNLVKVTVEQHAALHKQLWEDFGNWQDELAWKGLSGISSSQEVVMEATRNAFRGRKHSDETKKRMSERRRGVPKTEEHCKKLSNRTISLEHKEKLLNANLGRTLSDDHKNKLRLCNLGKKLSEETKEKIKLGNVGKRKNKNA
jgi:hypothetical protein